MKLSSEQKFIFKEIQFTYKPLEIGFHRDFTTAHSTSATRVNFIIKVQWHELIGYGEAGLPPKKPSCYLADISDCYRAMKQIQMKLQHFQQPQNLIQWPQGYFMPFLTNNTQLAKLIKSILELIRKLEDPSLRPAMSALQFSLFDLFCQFTKISLNQCIFPKTPHSPTFSFYTLTFQQPKSMLQNAKQAVKFTTKFKIKFSNEIEKLCQLLNDMQKEGIGEKIIIDANCSWSVEEFWKFASLIQSHPMKHKIMYIQQPYGVNLPPEWAEIKKKSPNKLLADESVSTVSDISRVKDFCHAVNIKTEKAGGLINSLICALEAQKQGLEIMFGSMCCTQLGCAQIYPLNPLTTYMDIDGALLVSNPIVEGGFTWSSEGRLIELQNGYGLKANCSHLF